MNTSALLPGEYYHVFNRGTNGEILFKSHENYSLFLKLYLKYIPAVADTIAYCLMPNHFHLIIRTKSEQEIKTFKELEMFENNKEGKITDKKPKISNQFAHLFNSYSKHINSAYHRTGSLFEHPFERRVIDNEAYLKRCIYYVHFNPVKAKLVTSPAGYRWSSFKSICSEKTTNLDRDTVLKIFEGKDYFLEYHQFNSDMIQSEEFLDFSNPK